MDVPCKHFWKDFFLLGDDIEDDGDSNAGDRFTYMFIYLSVYLSIFPSIHPSIDLPTERAEQPTSVNKVSTLLIL